MQKVDVFTIIRNQNLCHVTAFAGASAPKTATGIRRAGTMVRSTKDKDRHAADGDMRGPEVDFLGLLRSAQFS